MSVYNDWRGDAPTVAQVDTLTVGGSPANGDTVTVASPSGGTKTVTYTVQTGNTASDIAAALYAAIQLVTNSIQEYQDISFSYDATNAPTVILATSSIPGKPFSLGVSKTGTVTFTRTATTASAGPSHVDLPANWSLNLTPIAGHIARVKSGASLLWGLGSITCDGFEHWNSFTGEIGLPYRTNASETGSIEYRTRFLTVNAPTVKLGLGVGQGSSRLQVGLVASTAATIFGTSQRAEDDVPSCEFLTTGNPARIDVVGGDVGLCATSAGGTPTVPIITVSPSARFTLGPLATATEIDQNGGQLDTWGHVVLLDITDGNYTQWEGVTDTIAAEGGGYVRLNSAGTFGTVTAHGQGPGHAPVIDCSANSRARVFTNCTFTGGANLQDPAKSVTRTNPGSFDRQSLLASDIGEAMLLV